MSVNLSNEYYYSFEKAYEEALAAKRDGDMILTRDKLSIAVDELEKAIGFSSDEQKKQWLSLEQRLKAVLRSLKEKTGEATRNERMNDRRSESEDSLQRSRDAFDERSGFYELIDAKKLPFGFDGVFGMQELKESVREYAIDPILYPEEYNYAFSPNKICFLAGPPGTGKTTFAKAVAKEVDRPFFNVSCSQLVNALIGETGKNIDKLFAELNAYAEKHGCGIVVFFDEFDEIASGDPNDLVSHAALPALKRCLDGMRSNRDFLIFANTNYVERLETGILDRGEVFNVPLPSAEVRKMLFEKFLSDVEDEFVAQIDIEKAVELSEGFSGRNISVCCNNFKYACAKRKVERRKNKDVQSVDFGKLLYDIIDSLRKKRE